MSVVILVAMECWLTCTGTESPEFLPGPLRVGVAAPEAGPSREVEVQRALWRRFYLGVEDRTNILLWIEQLGRPRYAERELAQKRLRQIGPGAISVLRSFQDDPSPERQKRVLTCLRGLERQVDLAALESSIRRHVCPALAPDLWRLLESCPDPHLEEEIAGELLRLAVKNEPTRELVRTGLASPYPAHRACALLQQGIGTDAKSSGLIWKKLKEQTPHWPLFRGEMPEEHGWHVGPSFRARRTLEGFLEAMGRRDRKAMTRMCRLPFCLGGWLVLQSEPELEELLTQTLDGLKGKAWTCEILNVLRLESYAAAAEERNFVRELPARDVRVVAVRITQKGEPPEEGHFLILLSPRPVLLGIGK